MPFEPKISLILRTDAYNHLPSLNGVSDALTPRERDVLSMICQGLSNKRIARALGISPETVKSHVQSIFLKLDIRTRAEAAFRAGSVGLLQGLKPIQKEVGVASSGANRCASKN